MGKVTVMGGHLLLLRRCEWLTALGYIRNGFDLERRINKYLDRDNYQSISSL